MARKDVPSRSSMEELIRFTRAVKVGNIISNSRVQQLSLQMDQQLILLMFMARQGAVLGL